ncbi:MAG: hypothetical protein ACOCVB_00500 [Bacillota bacterium]
MSLWDSIKNLFKKNKKQHKKQINNKSDNEKILDDVNDLEGEKKELAEKAFKARVNGDYNKALSYWQEFADKFPENEPQAMARRARIYILKNENNKGQEELFAFFRWYCQRESFNYNSRYFTIFISALQDLGYFCRDWPDSEQYLRNLAGDDVSLDKTKTMARIKAGLDCLKEEGIWSEALSQVRENLSALN